MALDSAGFIESRAEVEFSCVVQVLRTVVFGFVAMISQSSTNEVSEKKSPNVRIVSRYDMGRKSVTLLWRE